jgi:hypothetical protein
MDWGGPSFVILIIAISTAGWLINNWIRARHGYALEDEWSGKTEHPDQIANAALRKENAELTRRLESIEQRTAALETIVTDGGFALSRQIDALRDTPRIAANPDKAGARI